MHECIQRLCREIFTTSGVNREGNKGKMFNFPKLPHLGALTEIPKVRVY